MTLNEKTSKFVTELIAVWGLAVVTFISADVMEFHHPDWYTPYLMRPMAVAVPVIASISFLAKLIFTWDEE